MRLRALTLFLLGACASWGQLSMDQKISDFEQLVGLYAKSYGPHDWKKQAFGVDLFDTAKWLDRIRATKNDLEFYDVMGRWVAQLDDAHDGYSNPSNFVARLNFSVDIYDGKLLIDFVDRNRLSASQFPLTNGYELVSIDGEDAYKLLDTFLPYSVAANPRGTRRIAAELLTTRVQSFMPLATTVPEVSTVVVRRFDGQLETYRIPWTKTGTPLTSVGRFPGLKSATEPEEQEPVPQLTYASIGDRFLNFRIPRDRAVVGYGSTVPVFARSLPGSFVQRLGRSTADPFYSGVFQAGGFRIGYIRIPHFSPGDLNGAFSVFQRETAFFQDNTDGLIVDIMRNGGGSSNYTNALLSTLIHYRWRTMGVEIRATPSWIVDFSSVVESLRAQGAPSDLVRDYEEVLEALVEGNRSNRGLTRPLPWDFNPGLDREPLRDGRGNLLAYSKPVMVLIDEFSASAADGFAGIIQDNGRGPLLGWRTMGAGGNVTGRQTGTYSGGSTSVTESLMVRGYERIEEGGLPVSRYVENVGVHPDIKVDYMTRDNLYQNGKPFVDTFVAAMVDHILRNR